MELQQHKILTQDGTFTHFHPEYQENYHSLVGAKTETLNKFIYPSQINHFSHPVLLDIGFGLGYNALYSMMLCPDINIVSLEKDRRLLKDIKDIHTEPYFKEILSSLKQDNQYSGENKKLEIIFGDARDSVQNLLSFQGKFTHIFLDAFSPSVNPELWTVNFFRDLYSLLAENGLIITYSSSLAVIAAFKKVGFEVFYTPSIGRKRGGLIAFKGKVLEGFEPITPKDRFLLEKSVQGVVNYDKAKWDKQKIWEYRKALQEISIRLGFLYPHKKAMKIWEQGANHG